MSDMLSQLYKLLADVVLPNLKGIQVSQAGQRLQTEQLNRNLDEFRAEMRVRFTEIRVELAACRVQVEDAMVTLRESETGEADNSASRGKKTLIH
jgi:predicted phage gp36 major capsid-like protein